MPGPSVITTTPTKSRSSRPDGSSNVRQSELKRLVGRELGDQVWQLAPQRIAEMLCPVSIKLPSEAVNTAVRLLKPKMPDPPSSNDGETAHYEPVACALNECVMACKQAVRKHIIRDHKRPLWYERLNFIVWAKPTADGVDGAAPLKPDLAGIQRPSTNSNSPGLLKLCWGLVDDDEGNPKLRILMPVEIKRLDSELVTQAATYGRALNGAVICRAFELVLAYNYVTDQFRFLIFHRGGLTCSRGMSLYKNPSDLEDLVRVFISIMSWTHADHAGFPLFTDGRRFELPDPTNSVSTNSVSTNSFLASVDEVLYHTPGVRSRNTWVSRISHAPADPADPADSNNPWVRRNLRPKTMEQREKHWPITSGVPRQRQNSSRPTSAAPNKKPKPDKPGV